MDIVSATKHFLLLAACWCLTPALLAETISGTVHNQTTGQVAAADQVVLLRLGEGMETEAKTQTDSQGRFVFNAVHSNTSHVVRVLHQGVNYDQPVDGNKPLDLKVFDTAGRVAGLEGNIGIAQIESDGKSLTVTQMYGIMNTSVPPMTQAGVRNFDFSVPKDATLDRAEVRAQGGLWLKITPTRVPDQAELYSIDFPIRPGNTLFKLVYRMPYRDQARVQIKLAYPIQHFAVMHPPSMSFHAALPNTFRSPGLTNGLQVEEAVSQPLSGEVPSFQISGIGSVFSSAAASRAGPPVAAPPPPRAQLHPDGQSAARVDGSTPKQLRLVIGGTIVVLVVAVILVFARRKGIAATRQDSSAVVKSP